MATEAQIKVNGKQVTPVNSRELSLRVEYDKDRPENRGVVTLNSWEFSREDNLMLKSWIEKGLVDGVGITEGPTFNISLKDDAGNFETVYQGALDMTKNHTISQTVSVFESIELYKEDWLNKKFQSTYFDELAELGVILPSDYKIMPYVINSVPDYVQAAIMLIAAYTLEAQILSLTNRLIEFVPRLAGDIDASIIIQIALYITELITISVAIVKLINNLLDVLIQPVKYHTCMNAYTMMNKACQYFGFSFRSTILEQEPFKRMVIMPEKYQVPVDADRLGLLGFTNPDTIDSAGYYKGTIADLVAELKTMFAAKLQIRGNEIWLVRSDVTIGEPEFKVQTIEALDYKLNADELNRNLIVSFQTDTQDKNTIQEYIGTSYQVRIEQRVTNNKNLQMLEGAYQARIGFALAKRKTDFSAPEKIAKSFLEVADNLMGFITRQINNLLKLVNRAIKFYNAVINALDVVGIKLKLEVEPFGTFTWQPLADIITQRIGMLKIEYDSFSVPKVFILQEGNLARQNKIDVNNVDILSAKNLYHNFHFIESPVPTQDRPEGNQVKIIRYDKHPFVLKNYKQIRANSMVFSADGKKSIMPLCDWKIYDQSAEIIIRIPYLYTNNLYETYYESTGF